MVDESIHVTVNDAPGRMVITAQLQPWDSPSPFALVSWSCQRYDLAATISGFGTVVETRTVDPLGMTTRSRSDGSNRTLRKKRGKVQFTGAGIGDVWRSQGRTTELVRILRPKVTEAPRSQPASE